MRARTLTLYEPFGEWLTDRMESLGISQRELALRAGISHTSISRIVREDRIPLMDTAVALIEAVTAAEEEQGIDPAGLPPDMLDGLAPRYIRALIARATTANIDDAARTLQVRPTSVKSALGEAYIRLGVRTSHDAFRRLGWLTVPERVMRKWGYR